MNRAIGTLVALGVVAAMIYAIVNYDSYTSICFNDAPEVETLSSEEPIIEADSLNVDDIIVEATDSLVTVE